MDDLDLSSPPPGKYPYRHTQDDRFQYRVKVQPAGDSLEFVVRAADTRRYADADYRSFHGVPRGVKRAAPIDDDDTRQDSTRRSVERAKRMVRLLAIEMRADRLLTFTTRIPYDIDLLRTIWDRFARLARTMDSGFQYVAVPEPHPSNPSHWHIHAAYRGWINVNILRRMWHAAILSVCRGADPSRRSRALPLKGADSPGNVDVRYRGRSHGIDKTRRIASYIGKYITKDLIAQFNKKRYWHTKGIGVPEARSKWLKSDDLEGALREVMESWGLLVDGEFPALKVWRPGNLAFFWVPIDGLPEPPF